MNSDAVTKAAFIGGDTGEVTAAELELINTYTRKPLKAEEVFVFSVVLCDNDVDRDCERFTVESLFALEKLFVGKTGIFDHDPSAKNQTARIFSCATESIPSRKTATGDDYFRLMARAYMPVTDDNRALREAIDSGIVKEVSIGCAVRHTLCSICGKEIAACTHQKGERYGGRLCCGELCEPIDAYEWSDCEKLLGYIAELKNSAKDGVYFRDSLTSEVLRLSAAVQPDISRDTMESIAKTMSVAQLKEFKDAFEKQKAKAYSPKPQLSPNKSKTKTESFGQFTI